MGKLGLIWAVILLLTWGGTMVCVYMADGHEPVSQEDINTAKNTEIKIGPGENTDHKRVRIKKNNLETYMELEDYLAGVIACQIPEGFEGEGLKCQAVIARTYIYRLLDGRNEIRQEELDLDYLEAGSGNGTSGIDQEIAQRLETCRQAAKDTAGVVMKYENRYILPLFHAVSAGKTRADAGEFPYLQSVESAWDRKAGDYEQSLSWTPEEFVLLINQIPEVVLVEASQVPGEIQTVKRDDAGYVEQIKIGAKTYSGEQVQTALSLPSACFTITGQAEEIQVSVRGRGHGYGLSQAGAEALSQQGWEYGDILQYYFKNISLVTE